MKSRPDINAYLDSSASAARRGLGEPAPVPVPRQEPEAWLLDSRDLSRLLGIGRTKAFQLMARAEVPVIHIGRSVRVPRAALERWIEANTEGQAERLPQRLPLRAAALARMRER
jgi:excisionase family DNA binding protein